MKAIWNNTIIVESNDIVNIEGNDYFPTESVNKKHLKESLITTICTWKGKAAYFYIEVDGRTNKDAAWYYPEPKDAASEIRGRVSFWKGVKVVD